MHLKCVGGDTPGQRRSVPLTCGPCRGLIADATTIQSGSAADDGPASAGVNRPSRRRVDPGRDSMRLPGAGTATDALRLCGWHRPTSRVQ